MQDALFQDHALKNVKPKGMSSWNASAITEASANAFTNQVRTINTRLVMIFPQKLVFFGEQPKNFFLTLHYMLFMCYYLFSIHYFCGGQE